MKLFNEHNSFLRDFENPKVMATYLEGKKHKEYFLPLKYSLKLMLMGIISVLLMLGFDYGIRHLNVHGVVNFTLWLGFGITLFSSLLFFYGLYHLGRGLILKMKK